MSKAMVGDFHRFGKFVRRQGRVFLKPRSGRLEFLFFDRRSPLSPFLNSIFLKRLHFQIECSQLWESQAEDVSSIAVDHLPDGFSESAAYWAYLSLLFGLSDIHSGNVLITNRGLQPIDLELAFEPVTNLVETGLLNHPSKAESRSGFFGQLGAFQVGVSSVVDSLLEFFDRGQPGGEGAVDLLWKEMRGIPIRRILRSTEEYRAALGSGSFANFWPEEVVQLAAGDIPYFFTIHPDPQIYYFSEPGVMSPIRSEMPFRPKLAQAECGSINRLLGLKKVATLQLLRRFWPEGKSSLSGRGFTAERMSSGAIAVSTRDFKVQSKV